MAPVHLDFPSQDCEYRTQQLEYDQAKDLLDLNMKVDHTTTTTAGRGNSRRPEKFPRPKISIDKSAEDWSDFRITWDQYKDEYGLEGAPLI